MRNSLKPLLLVLLWLISSATMAASTDILDGNSVIIIAHWDDEILWMDPVISTARIIIHAGPATAIARNQAAQKIFSWDGYWWSYKPYGIIATYNVFPPIDDDKHINEASGRIIIPRIDIPQEYTNYPNLNPDQPIPYRCFRDKYKYTYQITLDALRSILLWAKNNGAVRVITHNPWGEYGHPNHRNVSAVVRNLAVQLDMDVWNSSIVKTDSGYLDARFLYGVDYAFNKNNYSYNWPTVASRFISARQIYLNTPLLGTGTGSTYTWSIGPQDYPANQSYWRIVRSDGPGNTVDLLSVNPNLLTQVLKIRGNQPYNVGEAYSGYVAPLKYSCN